MGSDHIFAYATVNLYTVCGGMLTDNTPLHPNRSAAIRCGQNPCHVRYFKLTIRRLILDIPLNITCIIMKEIQHPRQLSAHIAQSLKAPPNYS